MIMVYRLNIEVALLKLAKECRHFYYGLQPNRTQVKEYI